jgi:protein-S-isoprenylcysteine O-methyltransferase Ste14
VTTGSDARADPGELLIGGLRELVVELSHGEEGLHGPEHHGHLTARLGRVGSYLVQPSNQVPDEHDRVVAWALLGVQLGLLAAIFLLPSGHAWVVPGWVRTGANVLTIAGLVVLGIGLLNLGRSATPLPTPVRGGELRSSGLYRYLRHPIYTGVIVLAIGSAIPSGSVAIAVATLALITWLEIKARWEERRLVDRYPGYAAYAARTPRFIPSPRRRRG